jgi:hypothetical protein
MATLIDEEQQPELELQEGETFGNITEDNPLDAAPIEEPQVEEEPPVAEAQPSGENPDRFAGRTQDELLEIVREQDRKIGQQGNELGNLRSTFEALSKAQSVPEPEPEPVEEADFFVDPQKAVDQRIHNHPALKEAREMAQKLAYAQSLATLQQRHPDLETVMNSEGFQQWITASPARTRRLQQADQSGDVDEADDLLSTYKEVTRTVSTAKRVEKQAQKKAVKNATVSATRSNPDAASSKRVYRSADIIELMKERPDRFEALENEIIQAYAEGRVRD